MGFWGFVFGLFSGCFCFMVKHKTPREVFFSAGDPTRRGFVVVLGFWVFAPFRLLLLYTALPRKGAKPGSKVADFVLNFGLFRGTDCTPRVVAKETGRRLGGSVALAVIGDRVTTHDNHSPASPAAAAAGEDCTKEAAPAAEATRCAFEISQAIPNSEPRHGPATEKLTRIYRGKKDPIAVCVACFNQYRKGAQ